LTTENERSPEEYAKYLKSVARGMIAKPTTSKTYRDENNATITETAETFSATVRPKIHIIDGRAQ
jgi:hypothetical protein